MAECGAKTREGCEVKSRGHRTIDAVQLGRGPWGY